MSETSTKATGSKMGRPSMGKSGAFKFRVTAALRQRLDREAAEVGRPVSEMIERRLNESFELDVSIEKVFGNRRNYARIAAIMEAMEQAQQVENAVIETDDDRECLKTLAAIDALTRYAQFYCPKEHKREYVLHPVLAIKPNNGLVDRALMRTDPYFATWHHDPDMGSKDDMTADGVEVRSEPAAVVEVETAPLKKRGKA